jgi:hypothetical protein
VGPGEPWERILTGPGMNFFLKIPVGKDPGNLQVHPCSALVKDGMITGVRLEYTPAGQPFFCESCVYAKATRKPVPKQREGSRATVFGGEIHSDLWGKSPVMSRGGKSYMSTYIDDKTRLTNVYFLRTKDEQPDAYKSYEAWVDTQLGAKIKVLNTDRGGEYLGHDFVAHLKSKGTVQKLSVHDTHQQSGVAERRNRTIVERTWALLHASGLPKNLWAEAAQHAVWLLNRTTTKAVEGMTPYEAAFGKKPDLRGLREWGERVWVRVEKGNKLGRRVREGRWLGMDEGSKGVQVYWPDTKTTTVERNTYFDDSAPHLEGENNIQLTETSAKSPDPATNSDDTYEPDIAEEASPEREKRTRKPSQRVRDLLEGQGTWSDDPNAPIIPLGVQLSAEGRTYDDKLTDWLDDVPTHVEGYTFAAVTGVSVVHSTGNPRVTRAPPAPTPV